MWMQKQKFMNQNSEFDDETLAEKIKRLVYELKFRQKAQTKLGAIIAANIKEPGYAI